MSTTYTEGKYQVKVVDQGFELSSSKGTPGFFIQFRILARYDEQGQPQDCPQYERTYQQWLAKDIGVKILKGQLKSLGVELTDLTQLDPEVPGHISLVGRTIDVVCKLETDTGKQQEKWTIPQARKKLALTAVRALDDQFAHVLRDGNTPAKPSAVTTRNDSDVAF